MSRYLIGHVKGDKGDKGDSWIYLECSTARNIADKVVTSSGFVLTSGARIAVRFTDIGSSNPSSGNLTLNVNNTGAKAIVDGHSNKTVMNYSSADLFYNNKVADFVYDGTYWVYLNKNNDAEISDIVNVYGAKNLCPTMNPSDPSTSSAWSSFFKINADGSITANGTPPGRVSIASRVVLPAGQYIMKGCPSGGNWNTYRIIFLKYTPSETIVYADTGLTPTAVTLDEETEIVIRVDLYGGYTASNLVYKPMICLKSVYDLDPTFEPYAKTNQQLTQETIGLIDNQNVNGAVNMLSNNITTQVLYGVTLTVNNDGTFTANGTASAMINYSLATITGLSGRYRLTGCPSGGSGEKYQLQIQEGSTYITPGDYGSGFDYSFDSSKTYYIRFVVRSGKTLNNLTFKPMLSLASLNLSYDYYVPYAKTNKELTTDTSNIKDSVSSISITGTKNITGATIAEDTYFYLNGELVRSKADIASGATLTLNTNYEVTTAGGLNEVNSQLKDALTNPVKVRQVSGAYTLPASGVLLTSSVEAPAETGYTAIGIVGIDTSDNNAMVSRFSLGNDKKAYITLANHTASQIAKTMYVSFLYVKNYS